MMTKIFATGAVLASLAFAGTALAQNAAYDKDGIPNSSPSSPDTVNPMPAPDWNSTAAATTPSQNSALREDRNLAPNDAQAQTPVSTDVAATLGIPVQLITSAPVPDTPANRAKYGEPLSHAGRMTKPAGN